MGLTINYKLSTGKNHAPDIVRDWVERFARYAREIGCAEVSKLLRPFHEPVYSRLFVSVGREEDCCFGHVLAKEGWLVEVWPGEGCESAHFGLCQYPRHTPYVLHGKEGWAPTGYWRGWLYKSSC